MYIYPTSYISIGGYEFCDHLRPEQMTSLEFNLWVVPELLDIMLIFNDKKWGYFRYYLAYGYSGTYWAGLEIEIDIRVTSLISVLRI